MAWFWAIIQLLIQLPTSVYRRTFGATVSKFTWIYFRIWRSKSTDILLKFDKNYTKVTSKNLEGIEGWF